MTKSRFHTLDCLRLLAALGVILFHVNGKPGSWIGSLYLCVDLFFILSGFVLEPAFPVRRSLRDFSKFAIRRYIRLAPMMYSTIAFSVFYQITIGFKNSILDGEARPNLDISFTTIVFSVLFLQVFSSQAMLLNYPMWSLSAEWIANLLLVFPLSRKSRIKGAASGYVVGFLFQVLNIYFPLPEFLVQLSRGVLGITLGVILRILFDKRIFHFSKLVVSIHICIILLSSICLTTTNPDLAPLLSAIPFSLLIFGLASFEKTKSMEIPANIAYWSGTLSFGIYAWHVPLSGLVDRYSVGEFQSNVVLRMAVLTLLSCVIAFVVSKYFERPVQKMLQKMMQRKLG